MTAAPLGQGVEIRLPPAYRLVSLDSVDSTNDEAIRLADRIAIMKDGAIIQIGTPEELVISPATDYVAEFTRDVPRAKVLSARSVMVTDSGVDEVAGSIAAATRIEALAAQVIGADKPFAITDDDGRQIGYLTRQAVLEVLVGTGRTE